MSMNGESGTQIWSERWHLAALTRRDWQAVLFAAVIAGFLFLLFHVQGNTSDLRAYGRSVFKWLVVRWREGGSDLSHAWLVPFVSLGLIWWHRFELLNAKKQVDTRGAWVVGFGLLFHWISAKAQQPLGSYCAFILLLWGIPFYLLGWDFARWLLFPCAYLFFSAPLFFLDVLTFPLRIFVTTVATAILNGLGVPVMRVGSSIRSLVEGGFHFDVADPCSGLRSLMAMTALTAVYAYVTQPTLLKKWVLFTFSIPLAVIGNLIRVVTIILVAEAFGQEFAMKLYHDYSGYIFFSVSISLMVGIGRLLSVDVKKAMVQWKQKLLSPVQSSWAF